MGGGVYSLVGWALHRCVLQMMWSSASEKAVDCLLRVGNKSLSQVKGFQYQGVLFTSEGTMEREVGPENLHCCDKKRAVPESEALNLPVNLGSYPHERQFPRFRPRSRKL